MYYRLPQVRRAGQRLSPQLINDDNKYEFANRTSDVMEFGGDGNTEHSPIDFELCKGLSCPLD